MRKFSLSLSLSHRFVHLLLLYSRRNRNVQLLSRFPPSPLRRLVNPFLFSLPFSFNSRYSEARWYRSPGPLTWTRRLLFRRSTSEIAFAYCSPGEARFHAFSAFVRDLALAETIGADASPPDPMHFACGGATGP